MHTYIFPLSTALLKGQSVHVCSFFSSVRKDNSNSLVKSGTLVLDEIGFEFIAINNVIDDSLILPQKLKWKPAFKEDFLIEKWTKSIQESVSSGNAIEMCVSGHREKELAKCVTELSERESPFISFKGNLLFRDFNFLNRAVWTRRFVDVECLTSREF